MLAFCGLQDSVCGNIHTEKTYRISSPMIEHVSINPNPVNQNTGFLLSVRAIEVEIFILPQIIYCGTFNCGQYTL